MSDETKPQRVAREIAEASAYGEQELDRAGAKIRAIESELAAKDAEIERLREIVGKLPRTADGVPVVPGMTLYYWNNCAATNTHGIDKWKVCVATAYTFPFTSRDNYYSTRAAAESAKGGVR